MKKQKIVTFNAWNKMLKMSKFYKSKKFANLSLYSKMHYQMEVSNLIFEAGK